MKYLKTLTYSLFSIAIIAVCGHAQAKPAASTCNWSIALPPAQHMSMESAHWKFVTGSISVNCVSDDGTWPDIKTDKEALEHVTKATFANLKKQLPGYEIVSQSEITVDGSRGFKYELGQNGIAAIQIRIIAREMNVYALSAVPADLILKPGDILTKTLDSFRLAH